MKMVQAARAGETVMRGVIYRGPSLLDGKPIVAIAVYSDTNKKTGTMLQTYILREDIDPREANKSGEDFSICGDCSLRGTATDDPKRKLAAGRKCYVRIDQGPLIVWKAYKRGYYKPESARALGRGRMVRMGTYGDPAAIPAAVWDDLLAEATGWTGYSHQSGFRPDLVMQSADTFEAAADFWAQGMRTFRVVQSLADVIPTKEVLCPASAEAGRRTTCEACKLCAGLATLSPKSVAIVQH